MLIQVRASKGDNYIQIDLAEIERIIVNTQKDSGEIRLKNGQTHLPKSAVKPLPLGMGIGETKFRTGVIGCFLPSDTR